MQEPIYHTRKVTIVGAGAVGSTFAYALMQAGIAEDIAIVDQNQDQAEGQVLDLAHGLQFTHPVSIHTGTPEDYADSQVIVIIGYKGATYFAVGLALVRIVRSILRNEHSVLTVSIRLQGEYDIDDVTLSVPCLVSGNGVERIIATDLADNELEALKNSASVLRKTLDDLDGALTE